jgi:hypothetical protein
MHIRMEQRLVMVGYQELPLTSYLDLQLSEELKLITPKHMDVVEF